MAEALKYMYSPAFFEHLCKVLKDIVPNFNKNRFINSVFDTEWPELELKQRTRKVTIALHKILPYDYPEALNIIINICNAFLKKNEKQGYPLIFLPDYVELYGLNHFEESMNALEQLTQLVSAEFAIRPFIIEYPEKSMKIMKQWSKHENHHVRRLASEGSRPRLPWAMGLPSFKKDPTPILPILENLKKDKSEYVRRSVANNLNDIAKDHPEVVLRLAKKWKDLSPETNWVLKHGSRTLLKQGHDGALGFHGFDSNLKTQVSKLTLSRKKIKIGSTEEFSFTVTNKGERKSVIRIEYAITFITSTGKKSRKIFKVSEKEFKSGERMDFVRKHRFTDFTTRKHFAGKHKLEIIVNGKPKGSSTFDLTR